MVLTTESRNEATKNIDQLPIYEVLKLINQQDQQVPLAIGSEKNLQTMTKIVELMSQTYQNHGRIFYIGAGTSGRLGVLDAVELVPTYGTDPSEFVALMAGGEKAMYLAVEGAEDSEELAVNDLQEQGLQQKDMVIGLAASGRTPYVIGGLDYARKLGAKTAAISCNENAKISPHAELALEVPVGPEVITGSTRMKAGTAQKLILNMMSTAAMIQCGKVYGNLMVDLRPTNEKLVERAKRIIQEATGASFEEAAVYYEKAQHSAKHAIVMLTTKASLVEVKQALGENQGRVALAIAALSK